MTREKAVKMLQNLRNCELGTIQIFGNDTTISQNMQLVAKGKANYLDQILHEIEPQTYPCSHPKIWNDVCDGQLYCMGCNQDI